MAIVYPATPVLDYFAWRLGITPVIPKFYWDAYSQEETIKELCKELDSIAKYSQYLGTEMNIDRKTINQVAETLNQLQAGGWFDQYSDIIAAWIRDIDNLDAIVADVLADSGITGTVAALDAQVNDEGTGIADRLDAAENDIDGIQFQLDGEGGIDDRLTAAENDIDGLQADIHNVGGIDERLGDAETAIDDLEAGLSLEMLRTSIPDTLHEATPIVRVPVDFVDADLQTHPQGMTTFGGTRENPSFAAVYSYHRVDTANGANTMGTMDVFRLSDNVKVATYSMDFGHGNSLTTDWENSQILVAEHSRTSSNTRSARVFVLNYTESGTLALYNTYSLPFTLVMAAGVLEDGTYWVWAPYEDGVYTAATLSSNLVDWAKRIPFDQSKMTTGLNQTMFYAPELHAFAVLYSGGSCIMFVDDETGDPIINMQIDAALGFLPTEELEAVQMCGTVMWLCNSPIYDNQHGGALNPGAEGTIWKVDIARARNYKDYASARVMTRYTFHVGTSYAGLPTNDSYWQTPAVGSGRIDIKNPRDLIALKHYPVEKLIYIDTPYPTRILPFIDAGFCILSGPGNTSLVNSNMMETVGGLYLYGPGTILNWFGFNQSTGYKITDDAIANWPLVVNSKPAWIQMTYFAKFYPRSMTITKTAASDAYAIAGEDGIIAFNSATTKTAYMYGSRFQVRDTVTLPIV